MKSAETKCPLVVTNPYELVGEIDKINTLFKRGLEILHVRKPGYSKKDLEKFIRKIKPEYRHRIVLHDHFSLVPKYGLRGIHLGSKERKSLLYKTFKVPFLKWRYASLKVSASVHHIQSLRKDLSNYDYVMFGPVFKKLTASDRLMKYDEKELKLCLKEIDTKVFALGGVTESDLASLHMLGFDNVVVQSYLWKNVEPILAFDSLINTNSKAAVKLRVAS